MSRLGTLLDLQHALGRTDPAEDEKPKVGKTYARALKQAAGCTGRSRYFDVDLVVKWWREHSNFTIPRTKPRRRPCRTPQNHEVRA